MQGSDEFALEAQSVQGGECGVGTGFTEMERGIDSITGQD